MTPKPQPARRHPVLSLCLAGLSLLAGLLTSLFTTPLRAEPSAVSASGFLSSFREEIKATPEAAWAAIVALPQWWNPRHSHSGRAGAMSLDAQAGGCWCERWTDAAGRTHSAMHGQVVMLQSGRVIRLFAALGPLQDLAVNGVLNVVVGAGAGADADKIFLRISYRVAGDASLALDKLAAPVDAVIGEQFKRLKLLIETGKPE